MKRDALESSLSSVFRLYAGVRLVFFLLSWISQQFAPFARFQPPPVYLLFGIAETLLLFILLSIPSLEIKLGQFYLPIALAIATISPFVENFLAVNISPFDEFSQISLLNGQWQLFIFLLVPLILISWRFSFKVVIAYCSLLLVLDIFTINMLHLFAGGSIIRPLSLVFFRTFVFLFVGYIIGKLVTEQRQQNIRLDQANRQLTSYANTLEQLAVSRERNRLAREFHDTLAHTLSAVAVQLEAVSALWDSDAVKSRAMLTQSLAETRHGLTETRRAIQALRAAPLEDLGLNLAIQNLAKSVTERFNLSLEVNVPDELPGLTQEAEHALYRILEEALHNTVEHAHATQVMINLEKCDRQIIFTFKDNGEGFDPAHYGNGTNNHFGLRGMQEYAESIQSALKIDSQAGQGTTITVVLEAKDGTSIDL